MIEGLKVRVNGEEIKAICLSRAKYHTEKAEWYKKQIQVFEQAKESLPEGFENMGTSNNSIPSMKQSVSKHTDKANWFNFVAEHLFAEQYQLSTGDMNQLEITENMY